MNDSTPNTSTFSNVERWITPCGDVRELNTDQPESALEVLRDHFRAAGWKLVETVTL